MNPDLFKMDLDFSEIFEEFLFREFSCFSKIHCICLLFVIYIEGVFVYVSYKPYFV